MEAEGKTGEKALAARGIEPAILVTVTSLSEDLCSSSGDLL